MVEEETVKLIDMGAVRQRRRHRGRHLRLARATPRPRRTTAPTPLSRPLHVARALAVLVADFDFQGKYEHSLPPPEEVDGLRASTRRSTASCSRPRASKPEERFQSAAEMAEQLVGVLRSVVGETADLGPAESALFAPDSDRGSDLGAGRGRGRDGIPQAQGRPRGRGRQRDPRRRRGARSGAAPRHVRARARSSTRTRSSSSCG